MLLPLQLFASLAHYQAVPHQEAFVEELRKQNQGGRVKLVIWKGISMKYQEEGNPAREYHPELDK